MKLLAVLLVIVQLLVQTNAPQSYVAAYSLNTNEAQNPNSSQLLATPGTQETTESQFNVFIPALVQSAATQPPTAAHKRPTATASPTPSAVPTSINSPTPSATVAASPTPSVTPNATPTPSPTPATVPAAPPTGPAYYVSLNGSDPGGCTGGTQSSPWKTWRKAEACVPAGSTVYFMPGTYTGIFSGSGTDINFKGTSGSPITIKPAPGAEGQVSFKQPLTLRGQYGVIRDMDLNVNTTSTGINIYGNNLVIQNNKIHNSSQFRCLDVFDRASNVTLEGNEVYNCATEGLETTGGTNVTFRGNTVHDVGYGIKVKGGAQNAVVENNRIFNIKYTAISGNSMGCSSGPCGSTNMTNGSVPVPDRYQAKGVIVRNNVVYSVSQQAPFMIKGWSDYQIYNNTLFNNAGWTTFNATEATWEFFDQTALDYAATHSHSACTIYKGSKPCVKFPQYSKYGKIKNNIVYGFNGILELSSGNQTGLGMSSNLYYKSGFSASTSSAYYVSGTKYSLAQFMASGYESGTVIADPAFLSASATSPNLRLSSISPAINKGVTLPDVEYDLDGVARPQGTTYDIGAFEYH